MLQSYFPTGSGGSVTPATPSVAGIAKLYNATGNNTDGSINQAVITAALSGKVSASVDSSNEVLVLSTASA